MKWILSDDVVRQRYIQKGLEQVSKYSWRLAAERVKNTYERLGAGTATEKDLSVMRGGRP